MLPLFSRHEDGLLIIEISLSELQSEWQKTDQDRKTLYQGKPAILGQKDQFTGEPTIHTIPDEIWYRVQHNLDNLSQKSWDAANSPKHCDNCGNELKMKEEYTDMWKLQCPVCKTPHIMAKTIYGGTLGQGKSH